MNGGDNSRLRYIYGLSFWVATHLLSAGVITYLLLGIVACSLAGL